ncbi:ISAs1 family transposase [Streptomyces radiopugnans]|uniref:ISAs1 family transposase n=1 Tax=Streptomyces radiopugnans TaxID=403935 RepID=UPI003F1DC4AD
MDGKTVRGARRPDGTQVHLLSAMSEGGLILAQREVDAKSNEITAFRPLLAPLDLTGTVAAFDALHSQTEHVRFLVEDKHAHYIALIKGNHPTLQRRLKQLPWRDVPLLDRTRATAHGRDEIRRIKVATVAGLPFPYADQALQIVRRRRTVATGKVTLERVYAVTSLAAHQTDTAEIARRVRGHRGIENRVHHVRDKTFAEDAPPASGRGHPHPRADRHRTPRHGRPAEPGHRRTTARRPHQHRRRPPPPRPRHHPAARHLGHHVIKPDTPRERRSPG